MKRLLVLLLALIMILSTLVSCDILEGIVRPNEKYDEDEKKNDDDEEEDEKSTKRLFGETNADLSFFGDTVAETVLPETVAPETEPVTDVPWANPSYSDFYFDNFELVFMTRDENDWSTREICAEGSQIAQGTLSEAVYTRNNYIHERHGVLIKEYKVDPYAIPMKVQSEVNAPTGDFHAVISNANGASAMSVDILVWDLASEKTSAIDLTKDWWDQNFVQSMKISDRLFYATGDLLTCDNDATFALMFNKDIARDMGLPDLYDTVTNNEWTFDKLYTYVQNASQDVNEDGQITYDKDRYGLLHSYDTNGALFYASGLRIMEMETDTYYNFEFGIDIESAITVIDLAREILNPDYSQNISMISAESDKNWNDISKIAFAGNHALFYGQVLQFVAKLRGENVNFGIIPFPVYAVNQGGYRSFMHTTGSVVSIPLSVSEDIEKVATMIEVMACYSQNTVTKAYYDEVLTTKTGRDEESEPMVDLILKTREYDVGYYYDWGDAYSTLTVFLSPYVENRVASYIKGLKKSVERKMSKDIDVIEKTYTEIENTN